MLASLPDFASLVIFGACIVGAIVREVLRRKGK